MFQSILLCFQPTGTTIAETVHSGIWPPPIARNASTKHLLRSALSPHLKKHGRRFPRSQASNPCRIQDGRCILCRLHSVSSIVSAVAPRKKPTSTSTSATICIKTSFTIVQCCSTSSTNYDGESFEQRKRVFCKVCAQCVCCVR